jgi:carbon-monoxide dehydrogenase catalytic subunit
MFEEITICPATQAMLQKASNENIKTCFDRVKEQKGCPFGETAGCCRVCGTGPCRISPKKADKETGLCGVSADIIAARNFVRMIAVGTAAHSDHARSVAEVLLLVAKGKIPGYTIKDTKKLLMIAEIFDVQTEGRGIEDIAIELAEKCLNEFSKNEELTFLKRAPASRQALWKEKNIAPKGIDSEVVESMGMTLMGSSFDFKEIMNAGTRAALADGWGGSMIATELQDILFGTPIPLRSKVNLGVLKGDEVNIIVHGHEPLLSEIIVMVSKQQDMLDYAKKHGANGINIAGICCTASEVLMRHGIPLAGNFIQQELAIITGAVEAMVVDVQCVFQSLPQIAQCYHTKVITTNKRTKIPGATHIEFDEKMAVKSATEIIRLAIENYPKRDNLKVDIPDEAVELVAGFSHETVNHMLGGAFRTTYRPLNDAIIDGRIRGVVGIVGCNNPRVRHDDIHITLAKELIAKNVLVVSTGCAAMAFGKAGLLLPEAAKYAGPGLAEICETVGIPPVLHCGSCVDNSRLLIALSEIANIGGLGDDIGGLPACGCAPEWMSEKAIAIGQYFVASGAPVLFGVGFPITGSGMKELLFKEYWDEYTALWAVEPDPIKQAEMLIKWIDNARERLGIVERPARILYDMVMRRELKF